MNIDHWPLTIDHWLCAAFFILNTSFFISCSDMMDIDSDRVAYDEDHRLDNTNDSIYSAMGVLAQLQQVADRTVLMGELRADLMSVDDQYASTALQELESLSYTDDNPYAVDQDFYAITDLK